MGVIKINDLPKDRTLDCKAMSSIRGAGGAPWVFGVAKPFMPDSFGPSVNLFQITNNVTNTFVGQQVNKFEIVNITNSGSNSVGNAVLLSSLSAS